MNSARALIIAAAVAVVAVAALVSLRGGDDDGSSGDTGSIASPTTKAPVGSVKIVLAFSPEKEEMLNYHADKPYVARENPSLVRTPLVISMWEKEAKALGWPGKQTSWAQILEMATSKAGWAQFGL